MNYSEPLFVKLMVCIDISYETKFYKKKKVSITCICLNKKSNSYFYQNIKSNNQSLKFLIKPINKTRVICSYRKWIHKKKL